MVAITATASSFIEGPGRACRLVSFTNCKIYAVDAPQIVDPIRVAMGEEATPLLSSNGESACVIISHGSEPVFSANELSQGEIGFLLESGGRARLSGNTIRMQKKCGVSVMLMSSDHSSTADPLEAAPSVVLDGGNLFDRCRVGVDVFCGSTGGRARDDGLTPWIPSRSSLMSSSGDGDDIRCAHRQAVFNFPAMDRHEAWMSFTASSTTFSRI